MARYFLTHHFKERIYSFPTIDHSLLIEPPYKKFETLFNFLFKKPKVDIIELVAMIKYTK